MNQRQKTRKQLAVLLSCAGLSVVVHGLCVVSGLAEPDAARLAVLAAEWHETGDFPTYSYALRTSPLYIHAIKGLLGAGVGLDAIPGILNWISVVLGGLTMIPLFFLWSRLTDQRIAAIACTSFFFMPASWLGGIYGMPHVPSFAFFVLSLLLFVLSLQGTGRKRMALAVLASLAAMVSVDLKADMLLCFGAFLGIVFYLKAMNRRNVALALLIPAVAVLAVMAHTRLIAPSLAGIGESAGEWSDRYPFTIGSLLERENSLILSNSAGKFLFSAMVLGVAYCIMWRTHLRALALSLIWALPPILFWGLKLGNSARHVMASYSALAFLLAVVTVTLIRKPRTLWLAVVALLIANYWISPSVGGINSPTSRLHNLTSSTHAFADFRNRVSLAFADREVDQKLYVGSATIPFVSWAAISTADSFAVVRSDPKVYRLRRGSSTRLLRLSTVDGSATVGPEGGTLVFSFEAGIQVRNETPFDEHYEDLVQAALAIRRDIDE